MESSRGPGKHGKRAVVPLASDGVGIDAFFAWGFFLSSLALYVPLETEALISIEGFLFSISLSYFLQCAFVELCRKRTYIYL